MKKNTKTVKEQPTVQPTVVEVGVVCGRWVAWPEGNVPGKETPWEETVPVTYVAAELQRMYPGVVVRPKWDTMVWPPPPAIPTMRERWAAAWSEWRGLYDRRLSALGHLADQYGLPHRALAEAVMRADMLAHRMPGRLLNWANHPKGWRFV